MSNDEQQEKNKREELLKFLALQNKRIDSHADKIWEEMKHFSWALYLLLGAPFILKHYEKVDGVQYSIWLTIFPLLAAFVAFIAAFSICKESRDFLDALGTILSIEKRLGFHDFSENNVPKTLVSKDRKEMLNIDGAVDKTIDDFIKRKQSIFCKLGYIPNRTLFVIYFIVLILFGIGEAISFTFYIR
ncbi:hypothetical protein [Candidatus Methanoperedens nitratireducens]|uniref:Uncharacterized protein n=1 Tax=Candidatus Methanoperedens nitratireducens TaxID=1392998 RepID=A0A284VMG8_9EURY|nr:hypothetical protein [Candidatus Methanoperedens nitroreducens]SNQ60442.1 hypothetical protein MNV_1800026 [Candidatus Methanoperedens nitroreducens]